MGYNPEQKELLDAIQIMINNTLDKKNTKIYSCYVSDIDNDKHCIIMLNGKTHSVQYYGDTPIINQHYKLFVPSGNMSQAFIVTTGTGGSGGTDDYNQLNNKPSINSVTLTGNKTSTELGLYGTGNEPNYPVDSVNGQTGDVTVTTTSIGAASQDSVTALETVVAGKVNIKDALLNTSSDIVGNDLHDRKGGVTTIFPKSAGQYASLNAPPGTNWGTNMSILTTSQAVQTLLSVDAEGKLYTAGRVNDTWSPWKQQANISDLFNKNLLDNPFFGLPYVVNQRTLMSYSGADGYCIDRWYRYSNTTVTINSGYLTLDSASLDSYLFQRLEYLPSGTYTLSINIDGEVKYTTLMWDGSTRVQTLLSFGVKGVYLGLTVDAGFPTFFILPNAVTSYNIYSVKLERGTVSTLANDPPANFGEQLAICQRYFEKSCNYADWPSTGLTGAVVGIAISTSQINGFSFSVKKRVSPTVTIYSRAGTINKVGLALSGTDVGTSVTAVGFERGTQSLVDSGAGFTVGTGYTYHWTASADL